MQVDLSNLPKIVSKHFYPLLPNKKKYLICYGGISSGKSVFIAQKLIYRILTDGVEHRILVVRKVSEKLRQSVFTECLQVLRDMGLSPYANVTTSPLQINLFGSTILFSGIDESEKIKSISRISAVWIEEATELLESDFDELADRLRTDYPTYKQIILSFNPISKSHWLYKRFFENDDLKNDTSIHKSTYLDNDFINTEEFGNSIRARYKNNANAYQVKVLGNFGSDQTGGEFYASFNAGTTVTNVSYDPEYPLILSWDFNVLPFSACLIGQLTGKTLNIINEIALESPFNRPINVMQELKRRYPHHYSGIYVTGDASGKANSTRTQDNVNDYTVIFEQLKTYVGVKDFVPSKNANVFQRGEFINALFAGDVEGVQIHIDPSCTKLIEDLSNIKRSEDGSKWKRRIKSKTTGQTFEEYGHMSDALDIMVTQFMKEDFKKYLRGSNADLHVGSRYVPLNLY
ncbi:MAG TPA: PBSX family phage terminase large subunit [Chryseolinea sp.]|nr:PBSX family phage terminase large subunit [Chryseolinea sp.]